MRSHAPPEINTIFRGKLRPDQHRPPAPPHHQTCLGAALNLALPSPLRHTFPMSSFTHNTVGPNNPRDDKFSPFLFGMRPTRDHPSELPMEGLDHFKLFESLLSWRWTHIIISGRNPFFSKASPTTLLVRNVKPHSLCADSPCLRPPPPAHGTAGYPSKPSFQ